MPDRNASLDLKGGVNPQVITREWDSVLTKSISAIATPVADESNKQYLMALKYSVDVACSAAEWLHVHKGADNVKRLLCELVHVCGTRLSIMPPIALINFVSISNIARSMSNAGGARLSNSNLERVLVKTCHAMYPDELCALFVQLSKSGTGSAELCTRILDSLTDVEPFRILHLSLIGGCALSMGVSHGSSGLRAIVDASSMLVRSMPMNELFDAAVKSETVLSCELSGVCGCRDLTEEIIRRFSSSNRLDGNIPKSHSSGIYPVVDREPLKPRRTLFHDVVNPQALWLYLVRKGVSSCSQIAQQYLQWVCQSAASMPTRANLNRPTIREVAGALDWALSRGQSVDLNSLANLSAVSEMADASSNSVSNVYEKVVSAWEPILQSKPLRYVKGRAYVSVPDPYIQLNVKPAQTRSRRQQKRALTRVKNAKIADYVTGKSISRDGTKVLPHWLVHGSSGASTVYIK